MPKAKTSIYVDDDLWRRFKKHASNRGREMTSLLGELIEDEVLEDSLDVALAGFDTAGSLELDFEPVTPVGSVSELIRTERDKRR